MLGAINVSLCISVGGVKEQNFGKSFSQDSKDWKYMKDQMTIKEMQPSENVRNSWETFFFFLSEMNFPVI